MHINVVHYNLREIGWRCNYVCSTVKFREGIGGLGAWEERGCRRSPPVKLLSCCILKESNSSPPRHEFQRFLLFKQVILTPVTSCRCVHMYYTYTRASKRSHKPTHASVASSFTTHACRTCVVFTRLYALVCTCFAAQNTNKITRYLRIPIYKKRLVKTKHWGWFYCIDTLWRWLQLVLVKKCTFAV